jgi:LysR family hydrogen peroxide-inducible transcriptional activator
MELQTLRSFLTVARLGSFSRAADHLGLTQPSLSQQIQKLERELGVSLFDRLGRSLRLTPFGDSLLISAERILREAEQARTALEGLKSEDSGQLRVGVIPTLLPYAMVEPLAAFQQQFPRVELILIEAMTEELIANLRRGEIDLALLALPIRHNEIICSELFREPLLAALPPTHLFSHSEKLALSQLGMEKMLLLREGHCLRDDVLTACTKARAQFRQVFESDHLESILRLVATGYGVSLVPACATLRRSDCRFVPLESHAVRRVAYALAKAHQALPVRKLLQRFLKTWKW